MFSARENKSVLKKRELASQVKWVNKSRMSLKRSLKLSVSGSDKAECVSRTALKDKRLERMKGVKNKKDGEVKKIH